MREEKRRLFLIDIMRVVCAFLIYARHSIRMFGCSYGHWLNAFFVQMTSPVMTCFFILSGFSIHYQHRSEAATSEWTRAYIKKKLISIMPSYLLVALIWPIVYPEQLRSWALLLPVDLTGVQTAYRTLFGILHNGGTWFVSCILLAYLLYPAMKAILGSNKRRTAVLMVFITHFILIYSNTLIREFSLDGLYSNPIARAAEFMIGAAFAELIFRDSDKGASVGTQRKQKQTAGSIVLLIVLMTAVSVALAIINHAGIRNMVFGYLPIPAIMLALWLASYLRCGMLEKSRLLSVLSGMSYQFFLMQLFLWKLTTGVLSLIRLSGNAAKITVSLILCTAISFLVWRFYDKPVRGFLNKRLQK